MRHILTAMLIQRLALREPLLSVGFFVTELFKAQPTVHSRRIRFSAVVDHALGQNEKSSVELDTCYTRQKLTLRFKAPQKTAELNLRFAAMVMAVRKTPCNRDQSSLSNRTCLPEDDAPGTTRFNLGS